MTKRPQCVILLCLASFFGMAHEIWAGDGASFVNLGFSQDDSFFLWAQYGVDSQTLRPWAELYAVDVVRNVFTTDGVKKIQTPLALNAAQDGAKALETLADFKTNLMQRYQVDPKLQGKPLYIAIENGVIQDTLEFRDFDTETVYRSHLVTFTTGTGVSMSSSFYIALERTAKDGTVKKYLVGTPSVKRKGISSYAVKKVLSSPKDLSLVFVVETRKKGTRGLDLRYMVETIKL